MAWRTAWLARSLARSPPGYFTNSSILVALGGVLIALVSPSIHHSPPLGARTPTTRRTRDRMVRRTNRATANVHRCFPPLRAAPRSKRGARAPRGEWSSRQFASSHGTRLFQPRSESSPLGKFRSRSETFDPNGDGYWRTMIIFQMFSSIRWWKGARD